jgi:hypothetical protein
LYFQSKVVMCATAPDASVMRFRRTRADGRFRFRGHANTLEDALELQKSAPDSHANAPARHPHSSVAGIDCRPVR